MLFTLEALRAAHGDCLLLHYGEAGDPKLILVDGGPTGIFANALLPRLEAVRVARGGRLSIEIAMVSHIDDDHVRGILDLARGLAGDALSEDDFRVRTLWLNAFEDTVGGEPFSPISIAAVAPAGVGAAEIGAITASVRQGRDLRDLARKLGWEPNDGFDGGLVTVPDDAGVAVERGDLKLTVVGPRTAELKELREEWETKAAELVGAEPADVARVAAYLDRSVYNLASIVCVAELGGKRILLTGDARGDKVLLGLESAGLMPPGGSIDLDVLKLPHHGSSRNLDVDFFERVRAPHLVISANGRHENPDLGTLEMIATARPDAELTIHFTETEFKDGVRPKLEETIERHRQEGRRYRAVFPPASQELVRIDLLDPLAF
ncbi:MAG: hypothetical protein R2725_07825 [Solirubrobacterales bacterium]